MPSGNGLETMMLPKQSVPPGMGVAAAAGEANAAVSRTHSEGFACGLLRLHDAVHVAEEFRHATGSDRGGHLGRLRFIGLAAPSRKPGPVTTWLTTP